MPDCDHFTDLELKDANDANWRPLTNGIEVNGGRIQIRGKVASGWAVSGEIERVDTSFPLPERVPYNFSDPYSSTPPNFRIEWSDYNPETNDNYQYKICVYADKIGETCEKTYTMIFRHTEALPPPPSKPSQPPAGQPVPLMATPPAPAKSASGTVCIPTALPGFHVRFPHEDAIAIYSPCDGLLVFGETPHCVHFGARLFSTTIPNPKVYIARPVRMDPPWWILQYKRDHPDDAPVGDVHLVVTDHLGSRAGKHRHIDFRILDIGCAGGGLVTGKRRILRRR